MMVLILAPGFHTVSIFACECVSVYVCACVQAREQLWV